jgi:arylsulfatase A-like enzyme
MPLLGDVAAAKDKRPNILFIFSDDHGYQALSCYGSKVNQTPNLDRIAKEGMRFDRCFVTNSICGPSRAVILTGKYSHLNGFVRNGNTFNGQQQTVSKLLGQAGYQTAMIGKWHLRSDPTGFDFWQVLIGQGPYYNPPMKTPDGVVQHTGYTTDIITDVAMDWLKNKRDEDKPFLLMYQHKAPHRNWQPGPKYLSNYDDVTIPEPETLFDDYSNRASPARNQEMTVERHLNPNDLKLVKQRGLTEEQHAIWDKAYAPKNKAFEDANLQGKDLVRWKYQRYAKDYLRCIDAVDDNVGRVLDYLDETGLAENTVVIYSSDQGWYLGEHGWFDKRWMYEESFRTPLMVRWPGKVKPGSVSSEMVMNLDFPELFLDVAGVPIPADMQGRSFKQVLQGKTPSDWRKSVYYHYYEFPGAHSVAKHYGVRTERHKLIHYYDLDEWELFDLEKDPHELKSVYDDPAYKSVLGDLRKELQRLRDHYKDDGTYVDFSAARAKAVKLQLAASFDFSKVEAQLDAKVVDGVKGRAIELAGKDPAVRQSTSPKLDPAHKPLTLGAWCKPAAGNGVLLAQGGESMGYSLYIEGGVPFFAVRSDGVLKKVRGKKIPENQWTHLAAVLDVDGKAQIHINGVATGKPRKTGFVGARPADGLSVGADSGSYVLGGDSDRAWSGLLEDVRLYWGVLDAESLQKWASR